MPLNKVEQGLPSLGLPCVPPTSPPHPPTTAATAVAFSAAVTLPVTVTQHCQCHARGEFQAQTTMNVTQRVTGGCRRCSYCCCPAKSSSKWGVHTSIMYISSCSDAKYVPLHRLMHILHIFCILCFHICAYFCIYSAYFAF